MKIGQRAITTAISSLVFVTEASAQLSITDPSAAYTIDFDTAVLGVNNGSWAGTGFEPGASTAGRLDSNAWAITGFDGGVLEFGGVQTSASTDFTRGLRSTAVTTGGIYAFSGGSITGVALGIQPTGTDATPGTITLRIRNDSPNVISGFTLDYVVHLRNDTPRANVFNFSHSGDDAIYTAEPTLNFSSTVEFNQTAFAATTRSITFGGLTINAGAFYYLRWNMDDAGGVDGRDEFALDDIRLSGFDSVGGVLNYWDPTGTAPGVGGSGSWTAAGAHFNHNPLGTDPLVGADPAKRVVFAGTAGTVSVGAGVVANAGLEFSSDGYVLEGDPLQLGGTVPAIKVTNVSDSATISAALTGTSGFRKMGAGRLVMTGASDFTGQVVIQEGTLEISSDDALGLAVNAVQFNGGTLRTVANVLLDSARVLSGTGALDIAPATTLTAAGATPFTSLTLRNSGTLALTSATPNLGSVTFEQAATVELPNGTATLQGNVATTHGSGTSVIVGNLDAGNALRTLTVADGLEATDLLVDGNVSASGVNGRLHKLGDGTLELLGDNAGLLGGIRLGTAGSTPARGGVLHVHTATALGTGEFQLNDGFLVADAETTLVFNNAITIGAGQQGDGASFGGGAMEFTGSAALFRPANTTMQHRITAYSDVTFSGGLNASTGSLLGTSTGLTITGAGTIFLPNANNSIAEPITVDGGHLNITGNLSAAPLITVQNGGRLSGSTNSAGESGERIGAVMIGIDGIASPGMAEASAGILHTGALTLLAGGGLHFDLEGSMAGEFDQFNVAGAVELGGELSLAMGSSYVATIDDTFTIILNDGVDGVTGEFLDLPHLAEFAEGGTSFRIDYMGGDGNDVVLTVVPEPGSLALLCAGIVLFSRRRRLE